MSAASEDDKSLSLIKDESVTSGIICGVPESDSNILIPKSLTKREKIHALISEIAIKHGVTLPVVLGPSRAWEAVRPRHEAIAAVAVAFPELSYPHIGRIFRRDHTTIMHACRKSGLPPRGTQHHTRQYLIFAMEMAKKEAGGQTNERTTHELAKNVER